MTTIVSAFISNLNSHRSIEIYINYGKKLCNININKIIFIEEHIYNTYFINEKYPLTTFIFISKEQIYLYKYTENDLININTLYTNNPSKDTIEYMYIQCSKTEWVRIAIEKNPYDSEQFIWLDFGIYHIMNNDRELFIRLINDEDELFSFIINELYNKSYDNVRIASGEFYNIENIYTHIQWFFLGGIFGGHKDKLIQFSDLMKQKCIDIITNDKIIIWEVNIWYLIYLENPELFDRYLANHNPTMLVWY
jgi:hypothetical protein